MPSINVPARTYFAFINDKIVGNIQNGVKSGTIELINTDKIKTDLFLANNEYSRVN